MVDTSRPDKVESESLLLSSMRVAVIDHHRRAADYIENAALNLYEPNASSSSELVTEVMQYLVDKKDILRLEAEALLTGIFLDTKGFSINTGARTFDAASFLKSAGADAASVKRLLQTDMDTAVEKYAIMQHVEMYREGTAIASGGLVLRNISIAQASDELLNIEGVSNSFAIAQIGGSVFVSGRSTGDMNVQYILEKLGGGGNQMTAGLQVVGTSVDQVAANIKRAIDDYISDRNNRK